jgi:hypothetical protein
MIYHVKPSYSLVNLILTTYTYHHHIVYSAAKPPNSIPVAPFSTRTVFYMHGVPYAYPYSCMYVYIPELMFDSASVSPRSFLPAHLYSRARIPTLPTYYHTRA